MAINSVNCFCMANIDGAEYILDSLHGRLWEVDVQTGGVRRHRKSRAQYMECGAAITLVHAAVMDHRLTPLERLLDPRWPVTGYDVVSAHWVMRMFVA